jgi:PRTase ComF-like
MHDFDIPGANESLTALLTLSDPAALTAASAVESILFHYPTAKLGLRSSIRFCAEQLAGAAREVLASSESSTPWVVASPPRFVLPGAANLMARELTTMLGDGCDPAPELTELWLAPDAGNRDMVASARLYSQAGFDTRVQERSRLHQRLKPLVPEQFRGRSVLFVNDINVTGAQQHFMRQAMQGVDVACIHWLYLVTVPPELGRVRPQIEYELNYSRHASFEDFAELVRNADLEITARCIHRLFDHEESELRVFLDSLPAQRQRDLIGLASQEARSQGRPAEYWERLRRLSV